MLQRALRSGHYLVTDNFGSGERESVGVRTLGESSPQPMPIHLRSPPFGAWCLRASSHAGNTSSNLAGVTKRTRDSDSGRSPSVRCGKYVSRTCTLDLAPVQVRNTFGVLLNRASLEVPFGKHQGRPRFVAAIMLSSAIRRILRHLGLPSDPVELAPARAPPELDDAWAC
jgi:hypothetical protein